MIDFDAIIKTTDLYNFHSHTQFCDGRASMEQFVIEAIAQGFTHYGFSPHSPIPFVSSCNMSREGALEYRAEVDRLREKYGDKIKLYLSMEIDYISPEWNASNPYFDEFAMDYRISAVHFIPSFDDAEKYIDIDGRYESFRQKMGVYFHDDIEAVVRSFYSQSMDMIEYGGFDIIGHFDKIGHNAGHYRPGIEEEEWYQSLVELEFEAIMDNRLIIEVNTKSLAQHGRTFPNRHLWHLLSRYKSPLLVNSDAHYPDLINAGRMETIASLAELGLYCPVG